MARRLIFLLFLIACVVDRSVNVHCEKQLVSSFDKHDNASSSLAELFSGKRIPLFRYITNKTSRLSTKAVQVGWDRGLQTSLYVISVGLGTPAKTQIVEIDTGSSTSWVFCECDGCHTNPRTFLQSRSTTCAKVSCGTSMCLLGGSDPHCQDSENYPDCPFRVSYQDGSASYGILYQDTLTFSDVQKIPGFSFGCNMDSFGANEFGNVDGLLGMGAGAMSVLKQSSPTFDCFSYCLPLQKSERGFFSKTTGYFSLGKVATRTDVRYTKMVARKKNTELFFVDLTAISVDGERLGLSPSIFSRKGVVFDSGSELSYIPDRALSVLSQRIRELLLRRGAAEEESERNCYDMRSVDEGDMPAISLHFDDGARFDLGSHGVFVERSVQEQDVWCLAFAPTESVSIIGSLMQTSKEVVYDLKRQLIGIGPSGAC
uniref:Peptidase A1 domain-containing protein n=1 Tax=Oryza barthii TaxID=65489 RepID=A0A0D3HJL4_9ORYZ